MVSGQEQPGIQKRYKILEKLGEGGMALVYKAFDRVLEREVAIKILKTNTASANPAYIQQVLHRFDREAKTLAKLTHPYIVHIHDFGNSKETPYLIMEYLAGGTLEDKMRPAVSYVEASRILLPIAEAIQYAHQQGILHRDIKPANILFSEDQKPLLSDFGIAKILNLDNQKENLSLTQTGMGIGTPEYMAPEQWSGEFSNKTDIYAFGVIFFEMVTGQKPYSAETPASFLVKQMTEEFPRPSSLVDNLPPAVENFLMNVLERDPEQRTNSMAEVVEQLQHFAAEHLSEETPIQKPQASTSAPQTAQTLVDPPQMAANDFHQNKTKITASSKKLVKGLGNLLRQILITLSIIFVILSVILIIGAVYITGLFSRQAIQNAAYENITQEELYRIPQDQLNEELDASVMPYFEDFFEGMEANLKTPDTIEIALIRPEKTDRLELIISEKDGYFVVKVDSLNNIPLFMIRSIFSGQLTRGFRNVLNEQDIHLEEFTIQNNEIRYIVAPN